MEWSFLSNFGITLFALLNPLGMLPIFISYTSRERTKVQRMVALFVSLTVMGLLLIFMVIGSPMLQFFGVTINSFRLAGGILLLIIGINIVNGTDSSAGKTLLVPENENDLTQAKSVYQQIVIPMAMPLLVGPGVIANVILYANEALAKKVGLGIELILMTIFVCFFVFAVLVSGKWLQRVIGDIGLSITQRVMGLFVAAIGVQFMVTGLIDIIINDLVPKLKG
ncbi:MAG: MarC family protein [Cyanobacteria bacterium]|nr:MarC family protein [Cyanobacteria bacterium CG_2015-16_32_12]NCO76733.1 MarC family protein [Cyanobacteria bacterium CG_2015-22_32_23]NCQ03602.1 MarC family protein [Cyanobacteria bacterium CG_2015-09_32_10]NCQ40749.1 MarC family protein [Cyanobacteria bacterium CG_2015-04_32_10]NCS85260.1 MarC family protein [Cyanobacteria bacterium CG_2015-02_32_10]